MSRPNTEGCTEFSCPYHGGDNQFKSGHEEGCEIRLYNGFILHLIDLIADGKEVELPARCTCSVRTFVRKEA